MNGSTSEYPFEEEEAFTSDTESMSSKSSATSVDTEGGFRRSAVYVWDGTVPQWLVDKDVLCTLFKQHCKKYTFQLEKGTENELLHFQCRVSLKKKARGTSGLFPGHWSPTSKSCVNDLSHYVTKSETRIDGPWSEKDEIEVPDDWLDGIDDKLPWQEALLATCRGKGNGRVVNVLVDTKGGIGKGTVTEMAVRELPHCYTTLKATANARDMRLEVASYLKSLGKNIYLTKTLSFFIDMPRAENMTQEGWSVIESIKGRQIVETRYATTVIRFMIPHVWVFTNSFPNMKYLSKDRWKIWEVVDNQLTEVASLPDREPYGLDFLD